MKNLFLPVVAFCLAVAVLCTVPVRAQYQAKRDRAIVELHRLGGHVVQHVVSVDLGGLRLAQEHFDHIRALTGATSLYLNDSNITDAGLSCVNDLVNLEVLNLENTQITDAAIVHLVNLHNLRQLNLIGTRFTDEGIAQLQKKLPGVKIKRKKK